MSVDVILGVLDNLSDGVVYPLMFGMALVENLFPPFPGDAVTVFGGYLAGLGRVSLPGTFVAVTLGGWLGFMVYYGVGRWLGRGSLPGLLGRWVDGGRLERAEAWFKKYGQWLVLANRFLSGTRSVISLVAGFTSLPPLSAAFFSLLSCLAWNILLVGAGYMIGEEWEQVTQLVSAYNFAMVGLLVVLALLWLVYHWRARAR